MSIGLHGFAIQHLNLTPNESDVFVLVTSGGVFGGKFSHWDERAIILATGQGLVAIPQPAIIAISGKREALDSGRR